MHIFLWLLANVDLIIGIVGGLHALALAIVNLTPTPKDDVWVGKAYKVIEALAGIFTVTAKEWPGEREGPVIVLSK